MGKRWIATGVAAAALGSAAFMDSSDIAAGAKQPGCGDTITADTTLHKDLINCPNNGIVIGANNITLNLNGHRIDGDGTEFGGCDPRAEICDSGVVNDGHDGVTVKHGRVREFGVGVLLGTSTTRGRVRHNRLLDISSSRNLFFGFVVASTSRSLVRNISSSGNVAPEGDGMGLFDADHVQVLHSSFRHNPGPGIHVGGSTDNLIKGNLFARDGIAVLLEEADGNRVRGNRVNRGAGILVGPGNHNVIARNRVSRAVDSIAIEKGNGNLVVRNVVLGARKTGIRLAITHPSLGGANNVVRRNLVRASGGDGFHVYPKDRHSLLQRNIAIGSGDDGFDIEGGATKLTNNHATRSSDLGFEAVRGVVDGGGNRARHNDDPRQCTNIACS